MYYMYIYMYYIIYMYPRTYVFFTDPHPCTKQGGSSGIYFSILYIYISTNTPTYTCLYHHPQGGSSGIGRAIVDRLAAQGLNVVVVAVDDALLKESVGELKAQFTGQQVCG